MRKRVNILTIGIIVLLLICWYFFGISLAYLLPIVFIYSIIIVVGSSKISLNYYLHSYCKSSIDKKEIAITFDDGPHPELTPKLLGILNEYDTKVTFFCVGEKVKLNPHIVRKIDREGHIVGNHTYYHSKFFDLFSSSRMINEIYCSNNDIYKITGKTPVLFRPPYGVTNPMLLKAIRLTNMSSIGWSLRSFDTVKKTDSVLEKLKSRTSAGDIVLFHDTVPDILNIVESYLKWLLKNNYRVVSLTDLLNIKAYAE